MTTPTNPTQYTELHTPDPARARAFYGELFGWKAAEEQTPAGAYTTIDGLLAGLTESRIPGFSVGWVPYFGVDDVKQATLRAKQLGGEILRDCVTIPSGTFSVVRDPTGATVGLWQSSRPG